MLKNDKTIKYGCGLFLCVCFSIFLIQFLNRSYPFVGHDYSYFVPRLLDAFQYHQMNGLQVQWYTPRFGGGLPVYGNPQDLQISLPQWLVFFTNPWTAILISFLIMINIGFVGCYYFLKRLLKLNWAASMLGALIFITNGFMIQHMAVGHLGYLLFPLLPLAVYLLFRNEQSFLMESMILSFIVAFMVYGAGFYLLCIFMFSILLILPLFVFFHVETAPVAVLSKRIILTLLSAICLTSSKLFAVNSFMQSFPRTINPVYHSDWFAGTAGIIFQLLGSPVLAPVYWIFGKDFHGATFRLQNLIGTKIFRYWELDTSLSPLMWLFILIGFGMLIKRLLNKRNSLIPRQRLAVIVFSIESAIMISIILARGFIYHIVKYAPIIKSLYVTTRFTSAFILPLVIMSAFVCHRLAYSFSKIKSLISVGSLSMVVFIFLMSYWLIPVKELLQNYNMDFAKKNYTAIKNGNLPPITKIAAVKDWETFDAGASSLYPYEPIFGYQLEYFHPQITVGKTTDMDRGFYNLNNAAAFIYPKSNGSLPFERMQTTDSAIFNEFVQYRKPPWKFPFLQIVANWISIMTLFLEFVTLGVLCAVKKAKIR